MALRNHPCGLLFGTAAAFAATLACSESPSFLVLRVDSDLGTSQQPGGRLVSVSIETTNRGVTRAAPLISFRDGARTLPGDHVVQLAPTVVDRRVIVSVTGQTTDGMRLHRMYSVLVPEGESRVLDVFLAAACLTERSCPASTTCGAGARCEPIADPRLREYTPLPTTDGGRFAPLDAAVDVCAPPRETADAGACHTVTACAPVCPVSPTKQPANRPAWRIAYIRFVTPASLTPGFITTTINSYVLDGSARVGLRVDLDRMTLTVGPLSVERGTLGTGLLDGEYQFLGRGSALVTAQFRDRDRWIPVEVSLRRVGDHYETDATPRAISFPFESASGLTEFPLERLRVIAMRTSANTSCIGLASPIDGRFNECRSDWQVADDRNLPYLEVEARLNYEFARDYSVFNLGTTLCSLIAGRPCNTTPMNQWPNPPERDESGALSWRVVARFAAVRASIADAP